MTFEETKKIILRRAQREELCPSYHDLQTAEQFSELSAAGTGQIEYLLKSGIVDTAIINEFDPDLINSHGIILGSFGTIDNANKKFFFDGAVGQVNVIQHGIYFFQALSNSVINFTLLNKTYTEIKVSKSSNCNINLSGNAAAVIYVSDEATVTINCTDISSVQLKTASAGLVEYSGSLESHSILSAIGKSNLNYQIADNATVEILKGNYSNVTNLSNE